MILPSDQSGRSGDIRRQILWYAIMAPSPLNTQPWSVLSMDPCGIDLYLEKKRLLPHMDPACRQACVSCGAFIENLDIAAREAGFMAEISLLPSSLPGADIDLGQPLARIELMPDPGIVTDPLFSWLEKRHTNRSIFTNDPIPAEIISSLADAANQPFTTLGFSADPSFRQELGGHITNAVEVTFSAPDRFSEFLSYVRIPPISAHQYPDGYGAREIGLHGVRGWLSLLPLRISPAGRRNGLARGLLLRLARKGAESAAAFGWIATKGNSRHDQIRAGRTYERVHLTAASAGVSLQPMTCVLESYPGMEEHYRRVLDLLGIPDTHTVQMLFRLGYSHSSSQSRRRDVQDFLGDTE